jgi:rare lipoprotein A
MVEGFIMQGAAWLVRMGLATAAAASLATCASVQPQTTANTAPQRTGQPYQVNGIWYVPREQPDYDVVGMASWYGDAFHGRSTADGEIFDMNAVSGAHTTLPLPSIVEVTNLENGRKLRVRVNDRGPFVGDRVIDLSHEAARELGYERQGLTRVRVRYVGPAPLLGPDAGVRVARAKPSASRQYASAGARPGPYAARFAPADPPSSQSDVVFTSQPAPAQARQLQIVPAMPAGPVPSARGWRIQAGAFSDAARAQRAVRQLTDVGPAVIEPFQRNGVTVYRVILAGPAREMEAYDLRDRVVEAGFADARVIGPS